MARHDRILAALGWVTLEQAATMVRRSVSTVSRMCRDGKLEWAREGERGVRVKLTSIDAYLEACERGQETSFVSDEPEATPVAVTPASGVEERLRARRRKPVIL